MSRYAFWVVSGLAISIAIASALLPWRRLLTKTVHVPVVESRLTEVQLHDLQESYGKAWPPPTWDDRGPRVIQPYGGVQYVGICRRFVYLLAGPNDKSLLSFNWSNLTVGQVPVRELTSAIRQYIGDLDELQDLSSTGGASPDNQSGDDKGYSLLGRSAKHNATVYVLFSDCGYGIESVWLKRDGKDDDRIIDTNIRFDFLEPVPKT